MRNRKFVTILLALVLILGALSMTAAASSAVMAGESEIPLDAEHFPDPSFLSLIDRYDVNWDGRLSQRERSVVESISASLRNPPIKDLTGLAYFPNLKYLSCGGNQLCALDLSQNPLLQELHCEDNVVPVRGNPFDLRSMPPLFDQRKASSWQDGTVQNGILTFSDPKVTYLYDCGQNQTAVFTLLCTDWETPITPDVFPDPAFRSYILTNCDTDHDQMLSWPEIANTTQIHISNTTPPVQDLTGIRYFTQLQALYCERNQLTNLDVSHCPNLQYFETGYNVWNTHENPLDLTTLPGNFDVSKASEWTNATLDGNLLTFEGPKVTYIYDCGNGHTMYGILQTDNSGTALDAKNFPDPVFLNYVQEHLDLNHNGTLSHTEAAAVTILEVPNLGIRDLAGIAHFKNLTALDCSQNHLTSLDLSKNPALEHLNCSGNTWISGTNPVVFDVLPGHFQVEHVRSWTGGEASRSAFTFTGTEASYVYDCGNGFSEEFSLTLQKRDIPLNAANFPEVPFREYLRVNYDADHNGKLSDAEVASVTKLILDSQKLKNLTGIQYFPALKLLYCEMNQLTSLDLCKNEQLEIVKCGSNQLTNLDIQKNTKLKELSCGTNCLKELDTQYNKELTSLMCYSNQLKSLDLTQNTALTNVTCSENQLEHLLIQTCTKLNWISCENNQLTQLTLDTMPQLYGVSCENNRLTSLNLRKCKKLNQLSCYDNQLSKLDLHNCPELKTVNCSRNQLKTLRITDNPALQILNCENNQLKDLNLYGAPALEYIFCSDNELEQISGSYHEKIKELVLNRNHLTNLEVSDTVILACEENTWQAAENPLDLTTLPGSFDCNLASGWSGAIVNGDMLTFTAPRATYTYLCGGETVATFTLLCPETEELAKINTITANSCTITPPVGLSGTCFVAVYAPSGRLLTCGSKAFGSTNTITVPYPEITWNEKDLVQAFFLDSSHTPNYKCIDNRT